MKLILVLTAVLLVSACAGSAPEIKEEQVANTKDQSKRVKETVASHTVEGKRAEKDAEKKNAEQAVPAPTRSATKKKWSRSGDPIDTSKFDAAVSKASADLKSKPEDAAAKKALGTAYFERAVALTAARQYASAIGDFRKALQNDPANEDAKKQAAMISAIYNSMNIEVPEPGEEPAPLEFKK